MADEFRNFKHLSGVMSNGVDFKIIRRIGGPNTAVVIAPHGGKIEPGSSEIADRIADNDFGFYSFEGMRSSGNGRLHITSSHFDEPIAVAMVRRAKVVVAIHGRKDDGDRATVYLGGLHADLSEAIGRKLEGAGFCTRLNGHKFSGTDPANICNRSNNGMGAQLEIPATLRRVLTQCGKEADLAAFSCAIRAAVNEHL